MYTLSEQSKKMMDNLAKSEWPNAILLTGQQTKSKHNLILKSITENLVNDRINTSQNEAAIVNLVNQNNHPDFYWFGLNRIKIGSRNKPDRGTVRHLIDHCLVYAPRMARRRFVYIQDASLILDEAESALLKSLEEPPERTHFILSCHESSSLKDTIVSRSIQIPVDFKIKPENVPENPWSMFWYLNQWADTEEYDMLENSGWLQILKEEYDRLTFTQADYAVFENISWVYLKEKFTKQTMETQCLILKLSFLPLYYAIRDKLIKGKAPSISPFNLPDIPEANLLYIGRLLEGFFQKLETRYFNVRVPALNIVIFAFLNALLERWPR